MKTSHCKLMTVFAAILLLPLAGFAQVNSGSNGSDGALNPTANLVIDMADHPDGIYHYTSVNIPAGVTVSFIPNAGNKPVIWLVQGDCVINSGGRVDASSVPNYSASGAPGGPGASVVVSAVQVQLPGKGQAEAQHLILVEMPLTEPWANLSIRQRGTQTGLMRILAAPTVIHS